MLMTKQDHNVIYYD